MDLVDKRVLVTGGSRGIGAALARAFRAAGAEVVLVARSAEALAAVAREIEGEVIVGDLLDRDFVAGLIDDAEASGPIDVLINNAGLLTTGRLASHSAEQIRDVFHLNLVVPAQLCAAAIPPMAQRGSGHLVNVSSLSMCANTPGFATYGASKAGLSALGESIREEIDGTGIGLTAVEVGFVETDMLGDLNATRSTRAIVDRYHRIGIQRMLDVDEVAAAVRSGVERGSPHVRLPRRSAAGPMMVNAPRRIARGLRRGLPPA